MLKHFKPSKFEFHPFLAQMLPPTLNKLVRFLLRCGIVAAEYCALTSCMYWGCRTPKRRPELLTTPHVYMLLTHQLGQTEIELETVHTSEEAAKYRSIDNFNAMFLLNY